MFAASFARAQSFLSIPQSARPFASLPAGAVYPEGIAVDPATGDVFVSTADFSFKSGQPNKLLRFDKNGKLEAVRDVSAAPLLGVAVDAGRVYFTSTEALTGSSSKIRRLPVDFGADTPIEDLAIVPNVGAPAKRTVQNADKSTDTITFSSNGASLPNAIAIGRSEGTTTLYFSDSFQGAVFAVPAPDRCALPCTVKVLSHDPLLATANHTVGVAANGVALDPTQTKLFIANLGDDRILQLDLATGTVSVFLEDIARPDGLAVDGKGRVWVCSLSNNELVVVDAKAHVVAKLGSYQGVDAKGKVKGLLGPASVALDGRRALVTNFVFPVTGMYAGADAVKAFSVAKIPLPAPLR